MERKKWELSEIRPEAIRALQQSGLPYLAAAVLASRGIRTPEEADLFLAAGHELMHSPFLFKDMDKAVTRIREALRLGERIAVFGDYDVDGITSTCLLVQYLRSQGANCIYYIPDRFEEGYGLNAEAISGFHTRGVSLIITVDCGITAIQEIAQAKALGIDVIVTDHHECKEELPDAYAVVDPFRPGCSYPFRALAGVGVAFKLALALAGPEREREVLDKYSPLAAIGTVADVVQMTGENRAIVSHGLRNISAYGSPGLHKLLAAIGLGDKPLTSTSIGYILAPRINASGRIGCASLAVELLLTEEPARTEDLVTALCSLNAERKNIEQEIFADALSKLETEPEGNRYAIVLADEGWHQGVIGIVASRLAERLTTPTFLICLSGEKGKGSCRSCFGINLFAALESASDLLLEYGGHGQAAGFTIPRENIPAFRARMNDFMNRALSGGQPTPTLHIDVAIEDPASVTLESVEGLNRLEPYGTGNLRPVFCLLGARVVCMQNVGGNHHLKMRVSKGKTIFECIFFSRNIETCGVVQGEPVDLAFFLQVNEFRSNRNVQLQLIDLRPAAALLSEEASAIKLYRRHRGGEPLTKEERGALLPNHEDFSTVWKYLKRSSGPEGIEETYTELSRKIAGSTGLKNALLRTMVCLDVFSERGLITMEARQETVSIRFSSREGKVDLEQSEIVISLKNGGLPIA